MRKDVPALVGKSVGLAGSLAIFYKKIIKKGLFAIVRVRENEDGLKFQAHFDWDDDGYEKVIESAKHVKETRGDTK